MALIIYKTNYNTLEKRIEEEYDMKNCPFKNFKEINEHCEKLDNKKYFYTWEII